MKPMTRQMVASLNLFKTPDEKVCVAKGTQTQQWTERAWGRKF